MDVFFTIDVEVSSNGWKNLDERFVNIFNQSIHGKTPQGQFGLPYQLKVMNDHGLMSVCFIEPLFSARFGQQPLDEVVGIVCAAGHEPQLHMHTEWVDEARIPLLDGMNGKRPNLRDYSVAEQISLIGIGKRMLAQAGVPHVDAFRAGSFAFNHDTLKAVHANGIMYDSSYNTTMFGPASGVRPGETIWWPFKHAGICEHPMTVFDDGTGKLRHVQLTACSFKEIEKLLWAALEAGYASFVILSHSFELLSGRERSRSDPVVIRRFRKLCKFLEKNSDSFHLRGFHGLEPEVPMETPPMLRSPIWRTGWRVAEQVYRRIYY
ncbi:MAG: polysaccharide deacetylase [Proteobacteria bacterium]|nr:polysaccharide deacetylase [Pseudomonadota bacterium]